MTNCVPSLVVDLVSNSHAWFYVSHLILCSYILCSPVLEIFVLFSNLNPIHSHSSLLRYLRSEA